MKFSGRDADFSAHTKLAAIGELRRSIMQQNGAVDAAHEFGGMICRFGDDALGMMRAIALDMPDRSIQILGKTVRHPGINQQMGRVVRDQDILDPCSLRVKGPRKKKQKGKNETDG